MAEVREGGKGGPEVMTPFGDTMGFVYGNSRQLALVVYSFEVFAEGFGQSIFGGYVEKSSQWMTWKFVASVESQPIGQELTTAKIIDDGTPF